MREVFESFDRAYDALNALYDTIMEEEARTGAYNDTSGIGVALDAVRATHIRIIGRNVETYASHLIATHAARVAAGR